MLLDYFAKLRATVMSKVILLIFAKSGSFAHADVAVVASAENNPPILPMIGRNSSLVFRAIEVDQQKSRVVIGVWKVATATTKEWLSKNYLQSGGIRVIAAKTSAADDICGCMHFPIC